MAALDNRSTTGEPSRLLGYEQSGRRHATGRTRSAAAWRNADGNIVRKAVNELVDRAPGTVDLSAHGLQTRCRGAPP